MNTLSHIHVFLNLKVTGSKQQIDKHIRDPTKDDGNLVDAPQEISKANGREILTKIKKLHKKVQKISKEKTSLEMELEYKEQQYKTLLSAMHEKNEVYNQFLRNKISKKKEKIKRLKEELHQKEQQFQPACEEAQILRKELSLALLELKKHEEVKQLQRKEEKLACSDHQFSESSDARKMEVTSLYSLILTVLLQN